MSKQKDLKMTQLQKTIELQSKRITALEGVIQVLKTK